MTHSSHTAPARPDAALFDVRPLAATPDVTATRFPCRVDPKAMAEDLDPLVEKATALVAAAVPAPDAILGGFVGIAALIRSVSFHEGRLLEEAMIAIGRRNPDLVVLGGGVRLPVTPAALEAVAHNRSGALKGLSLDADARARGSYAPDIVTVNRRYRSALVIDVKRSLASYLATHRLSELRTKMLAASLILPDWLYKEKKRLSVDSVGIAIVDGSCGVSEHEAGLWSLAEIDDLLEVEGAAAAMMAMRQRFAARVQGLIEAEMLRLARPLVEAEALDRARFGGGSDGATANGHPRLDADADDGGDPEAFERAAVGTGGGLRGDALGARGNHFHGFASRHAAGASSTDAPPRAERLIRFGFAQPRLHA
ncbi:hypothetical protein [Mangrovibrevibacter kandeliae]|uniref:hypothetical protein n=1 Tax=Mangrovibrevibacter kandeliae TaxID=2968473 RepID=UPI00211983B4|nr:hypothetical protein [Aurantimonas sp. CSK15Z-1]MCQ8782912.1 hypothetical protein [Aurantimonas sp. CSK15Z-1]